MYCLCQLKQRIITKIRAYFTGFLNADFWKALGIK